MIVLPAGSTEAGRRSGGSRWLSAPAPEGAGAACRRLGYRPAPRGARHLDPEQKKSAMKPFGSGPGRRTSSAARDSNLEFLAAVCGSSQIGRIGVLTWAGSLVALQRLTALVVVSCAYLVSDDLVVMRTSVSIECLR